MKVLSLFDGMACGMLAMLEAGIEVDRYVAFEIDKYAVQTSSHNFPMIEHRGDVFQADFTEFRGFDFLVGGSPCTYWSIAQKNNRETEASGMGWELFQQYVRALHEAQPKFFIYENNKSMSKAIRASIDKAFGFEAVGINSALVSAQNRQRLYWVGRRNADGTYSKVHVEQPEDRGILLKDVLDVGCGKGLSEREMDYMVRDSKGNYSDRWSYLQKPIVSEPVCASLIEQPYGRKKQSDGTYDRRFEARTDNKSNALVATHQQQFGMVAEPVGVGYRNRREEDGKLYRRFETHGEEKSNAITTVQTDSMVAIPLAQHFGETKGKAFALTSSYYKGQPTHKVLEKSQRTHAAEPVRVGTWPNEAKNQDHDSQQYRIYSTDAKGVTLCGNGGGMGAKTGLYALDCRFACPVEWDEDGKPTKSVSGADGKTYTVYEVKDGQITIKGKQYPIKLADGFYIIRKLTVSECKRLQTVPEWYEFPVSDTQAYKMLGNGWTVEVIVHLIKATQEAELPDLFGMAVTV